MMDKQKLAKPEIQAAEQVEQRPVLKSSAKEREKEEQLMDSIGEDEVGHMVRNSRELVSAGVVGELQFNLSAKNEAIEAKDWVVARTTVAHNCSETVVSNRGAENSMAFSTKGIWDASRSLGVPDYSLVKGYTIRAPEGKGSVLVLADKEHLDYFVVQGSKIENGQISLSELGIRGKPELIVASENQYTKDGKAVYFGILDSEAYAKFMDKEIIAPAPAASKRAAKAKAPKAKKAKTAAAVVPAQKAPKKAKGKKARKNAPAAQPTRMKFDTGSKRRPQEYGNQIAFAPPTPPQAPRIDSATQARIAAEAQARVQAELQARREAEAQMRAQAAAQAMPNRLEAAEKERKAEIAIERTEEMRHAEPHYPKVQNKPAFLKRKSRSGGNGYV
jgi:hypothetical protein